MQGSSSQVYDWFGLSLAAPGGRTVDLARPAQGQPELSREEKELIVFVMNLVAKKGYVQVEEQLPLLEEAVRTRSTASATLANIEREIGRLAAQEEVRGSEPVAARVDDMQKQLASLKYEIAKQAAGHVKDLHLLLRGVLLIESMQRSWNEWNNLKVNLSTYADKSLEDFRHEVELVQLDKHASVDKHRKKHVKYKAEASKHTYSRAYIKTYVDMCANVLDAKRKELREAAIACCVAFEAELERREELERQQGDSQHKRKPEVDASALDAKHQRTYAAAKFADISAFRLRL